uniref:Uncharacterized protein n=1 Tax=Ditylenchus dipsaci TaxID=166011 RepID=A0A915CYN7_9BILA
MSYKIFCSLAALCLCIYLPTSALKCYQSTALDIDKPLQEGAMECPSSARSCLLIVQLENRKIDRKCANTQCSPAPILDCLIVSPKILNADSYSFPRPTDTAVGYMLDLPKLQELRYCCCNGDGCNGSEAWKDYTIAYNASGIKPQA